MIIGESIKFMRNKIRKLFLVNPTLIFSESRFYKPIQRFFQALKISAFYLFLLRKENGIPNTKMTLKIRIQIWPWICELNKATTLYFVW